MFETREPQNERGKGRARARAASVVTVVDLCYFLVCYLVISSSLNHS